MAIGLEQGGVNDQAIVGDPHPPFEAEVLFFFGRTVALGGLGLIFAAQSLSRTRIEKTLLLKMWKQKMTIKKLRHQAKHGSLPEQVLLRGVLAARGKTIKSLASECLQLKPLIGRINQPENLFLRLGKEVVEERLDVPTKYFDGKLRYDDVDVVDDDFITALTFCNLHVSHDEVLLERRRQDPVFLAINMVAA